MRIDPALRALRGNDAPQRQAQDILAVARDAWRERDDWRKLSVAMDAFGDGADLADCEPLCQLFRAPGEADRFAWAFVAHFLRALSAAPLGLFPTRYAVNGSVSTLMLACSGRAALSLVVFDGAALARKPVAVTIGLADGERHDAVLAGRAEGRLVSARPVSRGRAEIGEARLMLVPGAMHSLDTARESLLVDRVEGRLVNLRLQRTGVNPGPSREYSLADGALVHQAAGEARESRLELMLSLLGRMGRTDAARPMAELAREGPVNLRWQALRECLALDTAEGFRALTRIAADAADPLALSAGALRAQLVEAHPVLASLDRKEPTCPL